jgi:acyl transferase domain-containing protein
MTLSKAGRSAAEPIAVIGLASIFPGAGDLAAYWAEILSGRDALTDIPATYWSAADYYDPDPKAEDRVYAKRGGFLSPVPFEPMKYGIVPNDLPAIDSTQLLALVAADRALADAGYPAGGPADHRRTAVILGVTGALKMVVSLGSRLAHPQLRRALADSGLDEAVTAEVLKRFANEFTPWVENSFPGLLGNVTAGRICGRLDLGGANLAVDAACASSLAAVRQALLELRSGQADLVITGGADTFNDPFMFACFSKTPALSPTGEVRPFDQDGDGTMLGEGVGLLVLKRLGEARRDGDRVDAVIREVGASSDGREAAIFAPTVQGQERALRNTYETAGIDPGTVELVEGHGTGTNVGDTVEVEALTRVFSQSPRAAAGRPPRAPRKRLTEK